MAPDSGNLASADNVPPSPTDDRMFIEITRLNSELVNIQRELTKKNQELARLNDVKNQFLGMASHDLRSPLTAILGYSEFLLEDTGGNLTQEQIEYLDVIHASSEFMLELVNNLLDIATIESGQLQLDCTPVDLIALITNNLALNRGLAAAKQIHLHFTHPSQIPILHIDDNRVEQVLNNLIGNAIKYSYSGSTVHVHLEMWGKEPNQEITVSVTDHGQGIPAAEQDRLFQAFSTTSARPTSGETSTGLGLLISRRVVEAHKGRIWVESIENQGSTFYFTLPVAAGEAAQHAAEPAHSPMPVQDAGHPSTHDEEAPLRVLLVEDNIINQRLISRLIEDTGAQVVTAPNGAAAVERALRSAFDLILMDIFMPEMDGPEATARILQSLPPPHHPYIAAMSASQHQDDQHRALASGAHTFMGKPTPSRRQELQNVLEAARSHRTARASG